MTNSTDFTSHVVPNRESVTVTGTYNSTTNIFSIHPMVIGAQLPTCIDDREARIRSLAHEMAETDRFEQGEDAYLTAAEEQFEAHTLQVVTVGPENQIRECLLPMDQICSDGGPWDGTYLFAGNVPYVGRVDRMDFLRRRELLHTVHVSASIPTVGFRWQPGNAPQRGRANVTWAGHHELDATLSYYLSLESTDGSRTPLSLLTEDTEAAVDFSSLPAGVGRFVLTATDGYNTVEESSERFYVAHRECQAVISSPEDGARIGAGAVVLAGTGFYDDCRTVEADALEWTSDQDGAIGRGGLIQSVELTPGPHRINLSAGLPGAVGTSTVSIEVLTEDVEPNPQ
jgi:hypothetical protein